MSLKSDKFNFHFSDQLYTSFTNLPFTTDPIEIGQLVPKIRAVKGLKKQWETKELYTLFGYILKSKFASSNSFYLITSQISSVHRTEPSIVPLVFELKKKMRIRAWDYDGMQFCEQTQTGVPHPIYEDPCV